MITNSSRRFEDTIRSFRLTPAVVFAVVLLATPAWATDYYVSASGADANGGTSPADAWQTIQRVNNQHFNPGDRILFEGGQTFSGSLYFDSTEAGTPSQPITITSFGTGRATIYPDTGTGILIYNAGGYRITDLYVIGSGRTTNTGNGIFFYLDLPNDAKVDSIAVDHVDAVGFGEGGVVVGADAGVTGFRHVRITNVIASDNGRQGIFVYAANPNAHQDVYIGYCASFRNTGVAGLLFNSGNGITLSGVDGGMIERSVAHHNGSLSDAGNGPIGIWTFNSNNVVIQFNESYNNTTGGTKDGGGFSLDNNTSNSILQYNYTHGNTGAGLLLAHKADNLVHTGNVVRYNISENDGRKNDYAAVHVWGRIRHAEVYNNTIYISSAPAGTVATPRAIFIKNNSIPNSDVLSLHIRNNIFIAKSVRMVEVTADQLNGAVDLRFENNDYYASGGTAKFVWGATTYLGLSAWRTATGEERLNGIDVGTEVDPQLQRAPAGVTFNDATLIDRLEGYQLQPASPMIDAGLYLTGLFGFDTGTRDFYGTALPQRSAYDIGAHEFSIDCAWNVSPASASLPAAGGGGSVNVTVASQSCGWSARSNVDWIYIAGDATGRGSGAVTFGVTPNPLTTARTGTLTVALHTFTIVQAANATVNVPPSVSISSPGNGAVYPSGSSVTISASANDSDGTISRVDFLANGTLLGSATTVPYTFAWNAVADGSYALTAKATDNSGASVTSPGVTITVGSATGGGALPAPWTSTDIGAVGASGSAMYSAGTFSVAGAGADIWGTADAFRFAYQPITGDGDITARVASVQNVDVWTKAGVMFRESLAPGARHASMFVSGAKGLVFQRRTSTGGTSASTPGALAASPFWVRVVRAGSTFSAYSSADGVAWTLVGTTSIAMGASIYVGLAVTSHSAGVTATATFDNVNVTMANPDAWTDQDIGSVGLAGSASQSAGVFTVKGAGADIWGSADALHYMYRRVSGDGQIVARVSSIGNTNAWAKAGVMIRDTAASGARHASMFVTPGKGLAFQRRVTTSGASVTTAGTLDTAPMWVKIVRSGSTFTAYQSSDGANWTPVGSETIALGADVLWGLAVTSHNTAALCTATFDNVTVSQP